MQIAILGTIIGIVLFLCAYIGFKAGLRLGMNASKGIAPPPVKSPVKAVQAIKTEIKQAKADDDFNKGFNAIMGYNGDIPKEGD